MPDEKKSYLLVSNSEYLTWNSCQRRYYYEYDRKLSPKAYSGALGIGVIGHELLETLFRAEMQGVEYSSVAEILQGRFMEMYSNAGWDKESLFKANELVTIYDSAFNNVENEYGNRRIKAVEQEYFMYMGNLEGGVRLYMPFKLDVVIQYENGETDIWDHKFVYNFYDDQKIQLTPQFQKYLLGFEEVTGVHPNDLVINQLRTRPLKNPTRDQQFYREFVPFRPKVASRMMHDHFAAATEIQSWKDDLSMNEKDWSSKRVFNPMVCNGCPFVSICISDLRGDNTDAIIESSYKLNEYGYDVPEAILNGETVVHAN